MNHSELSTKLEEIGIDQTIYDKESDKIAKFIASLTKRAMAQLYYDVTVNGPTGVLTHNEMSGHALKSAIVGAIGEYVKWDITAAIEIAADIAEDVNAHTEAATIRRLAYQEVI